jgi:hypothetical protein
MVEHGDSAEGYHRFRRERDHNSGMIPVSRRSEATLVSLIVGEVIGFVKT